MRAYYMEYIRVIYALLYLVYLPSSIPLSFDPSCL
jgi:hypothetical protein